MVEKADTRLLQPGWAGILTLDEALFIQKSLRADRMLRRSWHIRGKSCPLTKIAERAFPENPANGRQHIIGQMAAANRRQKDSNPPQLTLDLSIMGV
jgi:hypothetical protein